MSTVPHALVMAVAFFLIGPMIPAGPRPEDDPEAISLELTRTTFDALSRLDLATLEVVLADDYRYVSWGGSLMTKEERIRSVASLRGTQDAEAFELSELAARREGEAVVVVTGRAHQTGRFRGQSFDNEYRFTTVFGLRSGSWKAIAHQSTRIATDG